MKLVFAALAVIGTASPALAQDAHAGHDMSAHAEATSAARLSLDSPIAAIAANEAGKAVLDAAVPGLTTHEHFAAFKAMSLKQLAGYAPDQLTPEMLAKVEAGLAAIK